MLKIRPSKKATTERADLGLQVSDDEVEVPADVAAALGRLHVRTAEELVSMLFGFPTAVASELHWTVKDVIDARTRAVATLRGHVADALLDEPEPMDRGFGAMIPPDEEERKA